MGDGFNHEIDINSTTGRRMWDLNKISRVADRCMENHKNVKYLLTYINDCINRAAANGRCCTDISCNKHSYNIGIINAVREKLITKGYDVVVTDKDNCIRIDIFWKRISNLHEFLDKLDPALEQLRLNKLILHRKIIAGYSEAQPAYEELCKGICKLENIRDIVASYSNLLQLYYEQGPDMIAESAVYKMESMI